MCPFKKSCVDSGVFYEAAFCRHRARLAFGAIFDGLNVALTGAPQSRRNERYGQCQMNTPIEAGSRRVRVEQDSKGPRFFCRQQE
jgi:hypothetical protein